MSTQRLEEACTHYLALKERMRKEDHDTLAEYEMMSAETWEGWHYKSITKDNYLRLFYRVVWSSGFRAQTVFDKEAAYFEVLYRTFYPDGKYDLTATDKFLSEVEPILGGRKNKAIAELVTWIEEIGWERFKSDYITPSEGLEERLLEFRGIGPKTVKLLLSQTGICDTAKDDIWVTRFATSHGFDDPLECVRLIAERCGDTRTLVDAVLFWAGRKHGLSAQ